MYMFICVYIHTCVRLCACIFFSQCLIVFLPAYCRRMNDDIARGEVVGRRFEWLLMCGLLLSQYITVALPTGVCFV